MPTFRSKKNRRGKTVRYPITKPSEKYQQPFMDKYVVTLGKKPDGKEVRKTFLKEVQGYKVYSVDAEIIRKKYGLQYFFGGNGRALKFIPVDEIWLGTKSSEPWTEGEKESTIFHEFVEAELMEKGLERMQEGGGAHTLGNKLEKKLKKTGKWKDRYEIIRQIEYGNEPKVRELLEEE